MSQNAGSSEPRPENSAEPAKFEMAIGATKFGKFNICLILLFIPGTWTIVFEVTSMSYVFPAAECDLDLTIHEKGVLNGTGYCGMIIGGFLWGFLCDTLGRRFIMMTTYLLDAAMVILSGFSQNLIMLLLFKFLGGFFASGACSGSASYILEFHASKYRARVQMIRGIFITLGTVMLPVLGLIIMPLDVNLDHTNNFIFHSWNVYLFACALPSLISGIIFIFMPETPKFLMTVGRTEAALKVFQKIYSCNTGKPKENYPIKNLVDETTLEKNNENKHGGHVTPNRTKKQALREGCQQIRPMCFPPFRKYLFLVCTIQFLNMFSVQSIRLWLPQIFQSVSDYQNQHNGTTASLCTMLKMINPPRESTCEFNVSPSVYFNTMIIASVSILNYIILTVLINKLGKKLLIGTSCLLGGIFSASLYFAENTATVLVLASLFIAMGSTSLNILTVVTADIFPTTQRSVTISLSMVIGRLAAMFGNIVFPFLLKSGCAPPFFVVGSLITISSGLSLLLPNTDLKALE